MKAKTALILVVLAGLFGAGAWFLAFRPASPSASGGAGSADTQGEPFVAPAIRANADAIVRIEVTDGEESAELERNENGWVVASKGGYPANAETVRRLVTTLSELRVVEPKTSLPEYHARLGVEWPPAPDEDTSDPAGMAEPGPTLVRLVGDDGAEIAGVVLGRTEYTAGAARQYARLADQDQSVLASGRVEAPVLGMRYVDALFMELPRDSVRRVTVTHPTGESFTIVRTEADGDFGLEAVPEGMEPIGEGPANRVGQALAFVNFADVRPIAESDADEDLTGEPVLAVYELFDGTVLTLAVRLGPDGLDNGAWVNATAEAGPDGGDAQALNDALSGWSFRLPRAAAESLTRKPTDLMREQERNEAGPDLPVEVPELLRDPEDG